MNIIEFLPKDMVLNMERIILMDNKKEVRISEMPFEKKFDDYPEDTIFIWDDDDPMANDEFWEEN